MPIDIGHFPTPQTSSTRQRRAAAAQVAETAAREAARAVAKLDDRERELAKLRMPRTQSRYRRR